MKNLLSILTIWAPIASLMAGTFATISIDGDFTDWASIPVLSTDGTGDGNPADFVSLQAANDDDYLYLRFTLNSSAALNGTNTQVFIAIDNDNNSATGFDIFGLGAVGSEVGWQNDFPFQQSTGVFNSGTITNGAASISSLNSNTASQEIQLSRSATFTSGGGSIFPNNTISIGMYTSGTTADDFIGGDSYTFAIPEPSSVILTLSGIIAFIVFGRIRRK